MSTTPRFHRLAVRDLRREAPDAVSLTFAIPNELAADYRFAPGQYLTLKTMLGGEEIRRSYSICSGPDDNEIRIAVKRVDGGAFSSFVTDELKRGDEIDVMTPTGRFGVALQPEAARTHVGFAAGSGITPILSIVKAVLAREPQWAEQNSGPLVTSFVFRVRNLPAALYKALGGFATNGVNMTKLESYMVDGNFFATQFYADVDGHPEDKGLAFALEELKFFSRELRIVGVYPAHPFRATFSERME